MNDSNYNEQIITRYLLGALSDAETERLDELSVSDDEFAQALAVAEKELVDSYVQGELDEDDLASFKGHYLASPFRRDKVDFAKALQVFGERSAGTSVIPTATGRRQFSVGPFSNLLPVWQWGVALATLVLLVGGGLLMLQNIRLRQQVNQTEARRNELQQREREIEKQLADQQTAQALTEQELARVREERARLEEQLRTGRPQSSPGEGAIASLILTPQLRGAGEIKAVTIAPEIERVAIQLQLEPSPYSTYSVALIDQSGGQTLWRSGTIDAAGANGRKSLSVSFRAALLRAGTYRMQVSGVSSDGAAEIIGEYPFRVSR